MLMVYLRLRVEYSVNGVDRNRASIVGDTLVGRGGYSGYLVWRSGADLPGYMVMLFSGLHQGIMTRTIGVKVVG